MLVLGEQAWDKTAISGMAKAPKLLGPPPPPKLLLAFLPPPARNIPRQARLFSADGFKLIFYSSRNLGRRLSRSIGGLDMMADVVFIVPQHATNEQLVKR
mmetsp:Transcript_28422/g.76723  ORF Transcript_28422/g.76723 Transcript_28422/m.76723 type:complete len:100 (-) Transcript_28422:1084-1383(-)